MKRNTTVGVAISSNATSDAVVSHLSSVITMFTDVHQRTLEGLVSIVLDLLELEPLLQQ